MSQIASVRKSSVHYLDDLDIYSSDWESHAQHLALVSKRLAIYMLSVLTVTQPKPYISKLSVKLLCPAPVPICVCFWEFVIG